MNQRGAARTTGRRQRSRKPKAAQDVAPEIVSQGHSKRAASWRDAGKNKFLSKALLDSSNPLTRSPSLHKAGEGQRHDDPLLAKAIVSQVTEQDGSASPLNPGNGQGLAGKGKDAMYTVIEDINADSLSYDQEVHYAGTFEEAEELAMELSAETGEAYIISKVVCVKVRASEVAPVDLDAYNGVQRGRDYPCTLG